MTLFPRKPWSFIFLFFILFSTPAFAVDLEGVFKQGGMIRGQADPDTKVFLDGEEIRVDSQGRFVFGFGRDAAETAILKIVKKDGNQEEMTLKVVPQDYDIERIDGLPEKTVNVPEEERLRREKEAAMVIEARAPFTDSADWALPFIKPVEGRITGVYGSQRILNGQPRWPHYGLDIAGDVGTPVKAPAGGAVRLAEPEFLLEGGIIIIDHGFGVTSTFMHLSKVTVKVGQRVEQGDILGAIGMTGRASGPHLDWRINWGSVRLDPALVLEAFSKQTN